MRSGGDSEGGELKTLQRTYWAQKIEEILGTCWSQKNDLENGDLFSPTHLGYGQANPH